MLVVDDGSDAATRVHVDECTTYGAQVLRLSFNRGQGPALRAAYTHLHEIRVTGPVVTADADGQHAVSDILSVVDAVDDRITAAPHLVLGQHALDGDVPLRSRLGNRVTR